MTAARNATARKRAKMNTAHHDLGRSNKKLASRTNLGIAETEYQIWQDNRHRKSHYKQMNLNTNYRQLTFNNFITSRPHPATI